MLKDYKSWTDWRLSLLIIQLRDAASVCKEYSQWQAACVINSVVLNELVFSDYYAMYANHNLQLMVTDMADELREGLQFEQIADNDTLRGLVLDALLTYLIEEWDPFRWPDKFAELSSTIANHTCKADFRNVHARLWGAWLVEQIDTNYPSWESAYRVLEAVESQHFTGTPTNIRHLNDQGMHSLVVRKLVAKRHLYEAVRYIEQESNDYMAQVRPLDELSQAGEHAEAIRIGEATLAEAKYNLEEWLGSVDI